MLTAMMKYGLHPRTGVLIKVLKRVSKWPPLFRCQVIAGDRIYFANYTAKKLEHSFDPIGAREHKRLAVEKRQFKLFELAYGI